MAKLVVLSGVPGSGKSYFSTCLKLSRRGHVYVVSSDAIREMISGNQQNLNFEPLVWKLFFSLAKTYSLDEDGIVVMDATNSISKYRVDSFKDVAPLFKEKILVSFDIPSDVVKRQNADRPYPIPEKDLEILLEKFTLPNEEDKAFYDKVFVIKSHNFASIIDKI